MILGIAAWASNAAFLLLLAILLQRRLGLGRRALDAAALIFIWVFLTTLMMFVFGLAAWLDPMHLGLASWLGLALLLFLPPSRREILRLPTQVREDWQILANWWADQPRWLRWLLGVALVLSVARFSFVILVYPPFVWDSLTYHLTNVAAWTQKGAIFLFDTPVDRIYLPANYETLTTWFTVFLHDDIVVEASGLPAYLLEVVGLYALVRILGRSRMSSSLAALALALTPSILLTATGTKNDPNMAGYYIFLMAILADLAVRRSSIDASHAFNHVATAVLAVLLAAGTKAYIVYMLPGLLVAGVLLAVPVGVRHRLREVTARALAHWQESPVAWKAGLVGLLVAGVVLGGYWNIRNWILMGNPFYPYGVVVEGRNVVGGSYNSFHLSLGRMVANLQNIVSKLGDWQAPIQPDLPNTTGWGWFAYVLGVPSLAWGLVRSRTVRIVCLGFLVSGLAILMSTRPSPYNMRYILWFPAIFAVAFAFAYDGSLAHQSVPRRLATVVLVLTCGLNLPMTITQNLIPMTDVVHMLQLPALHRDAAEFDIHVPPEYETALHYVPQDELLGYNVTSNGFVYPLFRADFSQHIVFVPFVPTSSCQQIVMAMRQRGTRYLMVAPEQTDDAKLSLLKSCADGGSGLRERARGLYVISDK